MKQLSLLLILALSANSYAQKYFGDRIGNTVLFSQGKNAVPNRTWEILDQTLDHFDPTNTATFKQRYSVNADHFDNSTQKNVVFFYVNGEADASIYMLDYGLWTTLAPEYGALLVQLEHRYYGESQPYSNATSEDLKYLTIEQALADIASFIQFIKQKYDVKPDAKWILFGGSYPGNLVAWARLKYPHLVYASVASSAPVLAKLNFKEYYQVVIDNMEAADPECVPTVQKAIEQLTDVIKTDGTQLKELFNLCDDVDFTNLKQKEISLLQQNIAVNIFGLNSQYDNQIGYSINNTCAKLNNDTSITELERLAVLVREFYQPECFEINYNATVDHTKNTMYTQGVGVRQWYYQICTQLGYFETSDQDTPIFGTEFMVDYIVDWCTDLFPSLTVNETILNQNVNNTNTAYGGLDLPTDRILYFFGSVDPWHTLGILNSTNSASPVVYVKGASHGADMANIGDSDDLPALKEAKYFILDQIREWLN